MVKQFYRIIVSIIVFIISIYIFGSHISERSNDVETISKTVDASFPVLYMQVGKKLINPIKRLDKEGTKDFLYTDIMKILISR